MKQLQMRRFRFIQGFLALNIIVLMALIMFYYHFPKENKTGKIEVRKENYEGYALSLKENLYLIKTNWSCKRLPRVKVIVVVHSAVSYFDKRTVIRSTWADTSLLRQHDMRIVFFLGMTTDKNVQNKVEKESVTFNDIVQGNFYDSYRNMTHKGVLWLRWVKENCASAETVLKIDDDVFVNTFQLAKRYKSLFGDIQSNMVCELLPNGTNIIQRNNHEKWQVSRLEFQQYKYYPINMCRGYFVHMTANVVREMFRAAKETRFFWIDDVYLFGILTDKVKAKQSNLVDLVNERNQKDGIKCFWGMKRECKILGFLVHENQHMQKLWATIR